MTYERDSLLIMLGKYQTKEDIDKRREAVLKYNFTDPKYHKQLNKRAAKTPFLDKLFAKGPKVQ